MNASKPAHFPLLRPLRKSVVDAQGQACGEEEDGGNEALSEPCFQRVLPLWRACPRAEGDHHNYHRHGQGQTQPQWCHWEGISFPLLFFAFSSLLLLPPLFFPLFLCVFLTVCQTISRWSVSQSLLTPAGTCSSFPCAVNELICSKQQAANFKCESKSVLYLDLILQHLGMAQRQMQIHTVSKLNG